MMDLDRFSQLAEAWGGDIDRWPAAEQDAARACLETHAAARAVLDAAAELDALLARDAAVAPSELLARRILKSAPPPAFDADWRRPAVAAAAALVIGIAGGFAGGLVLPGDPVAPYDSEYADAFDGLMEDWSAWEWSDA